MEGGQGEIHNLRFLLQEKFGSEQAFDSSVSSVEPAFCVGGDFLTANNLRAGTVYEVVARGASSGVGLAIERLLNGDNVDGHFALIDGRDSFDPMLSGDWLNRVLWVRCRDVMDAANSADWLLRDGNLTLIIMDLQLNPVHETRRIPASSWYRLRALAEDTDTALCVFSSEKSVPCAHTRLLLDERFTISAMDECREKITLNPVLEKSNSRPGMLTPLIAKTG